MDWQIHQPTAKVWLPVPISYGILWQVLFHYRQVILVPASSENFWQKVAKGLGTGHSAMACQQQYYSHTEKPSKPRKLICAKKAEVSDEELSKGNTRVCVCVWACICMAIIGVCWLFVPFHCKLVQFVINPLPSCRQTDDHQWTSWDFEKETRATTCSSPHR